MRIQLIALSLLLSSLLQGQGIQKLSLQEAYDLSQKNYPAIKRKELVKQTAAISIENLQKGFLPQVNLSAQASYQSDVTKIPFSLPGLNIESPSKDQYRILADVNQLLYDGGITKTQKQLQNLNAVVEDQRIEVELYQVKERINQLFLGVLLLEQQSGQVKLVSSDIETGIRRVEAQVQNGVSFRSNLNLLKAELLKTQQRNIEISSARKGLLDALSLFIGQELPENVELEKPFPVAVNSAIERPELKLFDQQSILIAEQDKLIKAKNLPRASLFAQGGYGRPGLNMLKDEFALYYVTGLRLNWSLGGFYTRKKDKEQLEVNRKIVETQKESFLLNTNAQLKQQSAEIDKLQKLIESDKAIIELRHSVTEASKAQLENAVITANDYLNQVNAEDQARQQMILHEVQLIQAKINYRTTMGGN